MAALPCRCGHYIFALWLLLFSSPNLSHRGLDVCDTSTHCLSANLGCRSEMCCTLLAENSGCKKSPKICYLRTIAQFCRAISLQLRHLLRIGKELVKQQYLPHMFAQYGELRPTGGWDRSGSLGHPLLHGTLVVDVSRTLRWWTEGATYIWQGGHHVGVGPHSSCYTMQVIK